MKSFQQTINKHKMIIGMIHLQALPGTPKNNKHPIDIIEIALKEAHIYKNNGIKALILENMHDVPYLNKQVGPEITTTMALAAYEVKKQTGLFCGIQVLAAANKEALAIAHAADLDFIRTEGFVFGHLADEGYIESAAAELLRYRKFIEAENIMILTDIKKKHSSHAISCDTTIVEHAYAAEFFLSDGLIVTGASTGLEANLEELNAVKGAVKIPVFVGSGITEKNIGKYKASANGFIVGSYLKEDGNWQNPPDKKRIERLLKEFEKH